MKKPSDLRLLTLAILQQGGRRSLTKYRIMININHTIAPLLPPYSTGACYHELKLLLRDRMIVINQDETIQISDHGLLYLHRQLLEQPLPTPLLSLLVTTLVTLLLDDASTRAAAVKKLQIEMIKINQLEPNSKQSTADSNLSLNNWRSEILRISKSVVLGIVDN